MKAICQLIVSVAISLAAAAATAADVFVNGTPLDPAVQRTLEGVYQVAIQSGRYWYDALTGLWGREGGPAVGIIHPGLRIAGPLPRDASNGHTGVIVNGRELHPLDVAALQRCRSCRCRRIAGRPVNRLRRRCRTARRR